MYIWDKRNCQIGRIHIGIQGHQNKREVKAVKPDLIDDIDLQMNMIHLKVKSDEFDCRLHKTSLVSLEPAAVEGYVVEDHPCLSHPVLVDQVVERNL